MIYFNDLIWRSDSDQWKKASDFDELSDIIIIAPPPTPKEQKIAEVNRNFTGQIIGQLSVFYVITSLLIGFISYSIAKSSWDNYLVETGGKYLGNTYNNNSSSNWISNAELYANRRYKYYTPGRNNESAYGYGQGFWFRPFKAFGSTIYLTEEEQNNSGLLVGNLILSSFASLSFIFIIIGIIYYAIKRTNLVANPEIYKGFLESSKVTNNAQSDHKEEVKPKVVVLPRDVVIKSEIAQNIKENNFDNALIINQDLPSQVGSKIELEVEKSSNVSQDLPSYVSTIPEIDRALYLATEVIRRIDLMGVEMMEVARLIDRKKEGDLIIKSKTTKIIRLTSKEKWKEKVDNNHASEYYIIDQR